ncbi:hypothetical protein CLV91_2271 [Maribacter vaceletii]|uniref:Uncharacterized protein n=1 Tax=Maribacter vaceletii TaxID=1206816 RepID=A0A495E5G2_9FLAO|nr:hypothetical protein [Maribacter vaceletii]RKR12148.1 hypothetical protein CLV91_2271 [Maribacter vaceletii]
MRMNKFLTLVVITIIAWSCNNDDDGVEAIPLRLLSEVAIEDDAEIIEYLKTHFYNYEEFESKPEGFDYQVKIDTIAGDNANKISLFDSPELKSEVIEVDSDDFGLTEKETNIKHTLYYIVANKGDDNQGVQPTAMDSTFVTYEGRRLSNTIFDSADAPVWFDMVSTVRGFGKGVAGLKAGGEVEENGDGTFTILDPGVGVIFMPSGLAYFSGTQPGLSYSPIIFKVNLFRVEESDHDRDGVPTWKEDRDGDSNPRNDDTDEDGGPDYLDTDDDGDFTPTNEEIRNDSGEITNPDSYPGTENGGTADYLNPDVN